MKKLATLITAIALTGAINAHAAGSYSEALGEVQLCDMVAFTAKGSYRATQNGTEIPDYKRQDVMLPLMKYAKEYGKAAIDEQDAHQGAWGKCMDNINSLMHEFKTTGVPREELIY